MEVIVEAVVLAAIQLLIFYDLGYILPITTEKGKESAAETTLCGFVLYTALFEVTALIATWLTVPQNIFFYIWGCILSVCIVASLIWNAGKMVRRAGWCISHAHIGAGEILLIPAVILVLAECAFAALQTSGSGGIIAQMAVDLQTNSMGLYSAATGDAVTSISTASLLARWCANGEFYSLLTGLHPATYAHYTAVPVTVILSAMAVYRVGYRLFDEKKICAVLMLLIVMFADFFFTTDFTASGVLLQTGFSGDAVLAGVLIPFIMLLAVSVYEQENWKHLFIILLLAGISGFCVSEYAYLLIPAACGASLLPAVVLGKKWSGIMMAVSVTGLFLVGAAFVVLIPVIPFG